MTRVERRGHRRAEVDVAQAHDQVAGVEHRAVDLVQIRQVVDAADKFQVARAPGASLRTVVMYLSMASWQAGSSQDSGRWTMRDGTLRSRAAQTASHSPATISSSVCSARVSGW